MADKTAYVSEEALRSRFRTPIVEDTTGYVARSYQLNESSAKLRTTFDVFLCHSRIDAALVVSFAKMLEAAGLSVYIDWIVDHHSRLLGVSASNAKLIKVRMAQCRRMIYLHTPNASTSKWCPWEVGCFDGMEKPIYVALIANSPHSTTGQEYLDIYPRFYSVGNTFGRTSFRYESNAGNSYALP